MTAQSSTCPNCGKPVSGALIGLCPECLLAAGVPTGGPTSATTFVPPKPEDLAGRFPQLEILELLGHGGMGAVYQARQKQLDRLVALKILPPGVSHDPAFAERFAREAKALARLHHPNIVTLYEFGQTDGQYFFLMEFVDGLNLRRLIEAGRLAPKEALAIVPQICDALQFAHDQRIIHRDIKPENILLTKSGQVKIADFGVAKLLAPETSPASIANQPPSPGEQTEAGKVVGTPSYMAPEQFTNPDEVDNRADIYALGVVFYQMLTGELPAGKFEPPSARMRGVQIDVRLDEVVLRALEKEPSLRYQQASEVKERVQTIASTSSAPHSASAASDPPPPFAKAIAHLLGATFTSRLALQVANLSALGFLCFLGFVPLRGWHRLLGFSGFFGLIGIAVIIEAVTRCTRTYDHARALSFSLKNPGVFLLGFLALCLVAFGLLEVSARRNLAREQASLAASLAARAKSDSPIPVKITHVSKGDLPIHLLAIGTVDKGTAGSSEQGTSVGASFAIPESQVQSIYKRFRSNEKLAVVARDQAGKIVARGTLSGMDNQIDSAAGTLACKTSLTREGDAILLPGQFLSLELLIETKRDATIIPVSAVETRAEAAAESPDSSTSTSEHFVWVLRPDHTVAMRPITIDALENGRVAVATGLIPGEPIVIAPPAILSEGAKVTTSPPK